MILKCKCTHTEQDRLHGSQMRVCNPMHNPMGSFRYRCTVCGETVSKGDSQPIKKKGKKA